MQSQATQSTPSHKVAQGRSFPVIPTSIALYGLRPWLTQVADCVALLSLALRPRKSRGSQLQRREPSA